jgi:formate/nitrite transporter FocA (FNT family)
MAQIAPVLAGYQFFKELLDPVMRIFKNNRAGSLFIFYFIYLQWFRVSRLNCFYTNSHKASAHKFDNSWLSLAGSYKLVMTFVFGQNIKISI